VNLVNFAKKPVAILDFWTSTRSEVFKQKESSEVQRKMLVPSSSGAARVRRQSPIFSYFA